NLLSTTDRVAAAISAPRPSCARPQTATHFSWSVVSTRSTPRIRDIAPVGSVIRFPYVMVVNPSVPAKSVPEFIAYAKANPGKVNMASAGIGSGNHTAGELFKMMTGVNLVHVPYRGGGPALIDLLGGQRQFSIKCWKRLNIPQHQIAVASN